MTAIWNIATQAEFEQKAMELFRFQAEHCAPYKEYLRLVDCDPEKVQSIEAIPFLPIELFKSQRVYCGDGEPEMVFTSSGDVQSEHPMASLAHYEECCIRGFEQHYGCLADWSIYALLPSYLEREGSSLIYMVDRMIARTRSGGFYLYDHEKLLQDMAADPKKKILLGVSYALLDLAESGLVEGFGDGVIVMETGGMKGRREEMEKAELHAVLCSDLGVSKIHSEYGMAELTSQAYSFGENIFACPPWMRVLARELGDPFSYVEAEQIGGINIIDLANDTSCAFIQTQDLGKVYNDGRFSVDGRIRMSDIRGCNLLI